MSLYKRGGTYWSYIVMDGQRHCQSTGTGNLREAQTIEQKFRAELNAQRFGIQRFDRHLTAGAAIARFLAEGQPTKYHLDRIKKLLPAVADLPMMRLGKAWAEEYRQARRDSDKVSDATVNRDLAVLRRIGYWSLDAGFIPANPLARLRLVAERKKPRVMISVAEEEKLLTAASVHLRRLIVAALDTGLRRGELLNQSWEHVDLARKLLFVTKSKTASGEGREIPTTRRLHDLLTAQPEKAGLVFTYHDQPLKRIKTGWKAALRRAGLRHIRFHDLRHAFASRLTDAGVLADVRMALMGHSAGSSIHAGYVHVDLTQKREAIAKLEAWRKNQVELIGGKNGNQTARDARQQGRSDPTSPGSGQAAENLEAENPHPDHSGAG